MTNRVTMRERWTTPKGDIQLIRQSEFRVLRYLQKNQRVVFCVLCDKMLPDVTDRNARRDRMTHILQGLVPVGLVGVEPIGKSRRAFGNNISLSLHPGIFTETSIYLKSPAKTTAIVELLKNIDWFGIRVDENEALKCLLSIYGEAGEIGVSRVADITGTRTTLYQLYRHIQEGTTGECTAYQQKIAQYIEFVTQKNTETGIKGLCCFLNTEGLKVVVTWIQVTSVLDAIAAEHTP